MKTSHLFSVFLLGCAALCGGAQNYENPALNPVKFQKNPNHPELLLIKDGKADFAIVADLRTEKKQNRGGSHRLSIKLASEALADGFTRCFGITPPILPPDSPELRKYSYKILLGRSSMTDAMGIDPFRTAEEGFLVKTFPEGIVIAGYDGSMLPGYYKKFDRPGVACNGTLYGVYDFMERFLGMRFYYPGIGTYVPPRRKELAVKSVSYSDAPKYRRYNTWFIAAEFGKKFPWSGVADDSAAYRGAYRAYETASFGGVETPHPFQIAKDYPDRLDTIFYREPNGRLRYSPSVYSENSFDVTNPAFADLLVDYWKLRIDSGNKRGGMISGDYLVFGQCDTNRIFENEAAKRLRRNPPVFPYNEMSEVYGAFYHYLAEQAGKKLPGKRVSALAYKNYISAPEKIAKFPDNFTIVVCAGTPDFIRNKTHRAFIEEIYGGWQKKITGKPIVYTYPGSPSGAFYGEFYGEFLRSMASRIDERNIFPCSQPSWEVYYSKYLLMRALWNPAFNKDAAMDEHWRLLYGEKAGDCLKRFYSLLLKHWNDKFIPAFKPDKRSIPHYDRHQLFSKVYTRAVGMELQQLLDQAHKAVRPGSVEEKRLAFFEKAWKPHIQTMFTYQNYKEPFYRIVMLDENDRVKIDGVPDEPVWKRASRLSFQPTLFGGRIPQEKSEAKICWDETGIYLAFTSKAPYAMKPDGVWNGDNVELFLSPGRKKESIFQFAAGANGKLASTFTDVIYQRRDSAWKAQGLKAAVKAGKDGWTLEMFIPFSCLENTAPPYAGDFWYGNLVSNTMLPQPASSAFSVTLGNNYNHHLYGKFYFAGNCE